MHFDKIFTTCPYLTGSTEGVVCSARCILLRNLDNINPDMCISRHFEICQIYIEKLQELDVLSIANNGNVSAMYNKNVTIPSYDI
jgi:hypothetical protein